jgi:hypothetical protein
VTASGGALLAAMHALLDGTLAPEIDSEHAEGVLLELRARPRLSSRDRKMSSPE